MIELQNGSPELALDLAEKAAAVASERKAPEDLVLLPQLLLTQGAAHEELRDLACTGHLQPSSGGGTRTPSGHARQRPSAAGLGQLDEGLQVLQSTVDAGRDDQRFLDATQKLIKGVKRFQSDDLHPRNFVDAHRGSYVEFFNHHADEMAGKGWIAEAARMRKDEQGNLVPVVAEGANRMQAHGLTW